MAAIWTLIICLKFNHVEKCIFFTLLTENILYWYRYVLLILDAYQTSASVEWNEFVKDDIRFLFSMIHITKETTHVGGWTVTFPSGESAVSVKCRLVEGNDFAIEGLYILGSLTMRTKKLLLWANVCFFFLSSSSKTSSLCSWKYILHYYLLKVGALHSILEQVDLSKFY